MNTVIFESLRVTPSKVVCVGRNYVDHIKELNNEIPESMVLFMKPNSAITDQLLTKPNTTLHFESEISFLIKNNRISAAAFGLDLTDRTIQSQLKSKGLPWERAKAFDGSAVFGEFVAINEEDIENLSIELWVNDSLAQFGNTGLMIYKPQTVVQEINSFSTLYENDIIMSGTPKGVGSYQAGDHFVGKIFLNGKEISSVEWTAI